MKRANNRKIMERIIPIDPELEKGYNVRLLVDDFDGLIENGLTGVKNLEPK